MKIPMRLMSRLRLSLRTLGHMACSILALTALEAQAYTCGFDNIFTDNMTIPVIGSGLSTIGEDVPVGQIIYTARFNANLRTTNYYCTVTAEEVAAGHEPVTARYYSKIDTVTTPSGAPTISGDTAIYPTNVPGIGAIFSLVGSPGDSKKFPAIWESDLHVNLGTIRQNVGQIGRINLQLIKTGPISPGTHQVLASSFPTFHVTSGSTLPIVFDHTFVTINFSGAMTMYARTCQLATSVVDVSLGTHTRGEFTGVGSATPWTEFDITLRDCPAFVGYGNYAYNEATAVTTGKGTANKVAILFNSVHGIVDNNPLLAKLESGPDSAQGIGIEVSERNSTTSLSFDGSGGFNLQNLPTVEGEGYVIPLKARYVQYESEVKAGVANGAAVFTITYN